jgi:hypothetical protein
MYIIDEFAAFLSMHNGVQSVTQSEQAAKSTEQNSPQKITCSAVQEIPRLVFNLKLHYPVHKISTLDPNGPDESIPRFLSEFF